MGAIYHLGRKEYLNLLLRLLDKADENLGTIILNILTDLEERKHDSTLAEDAPDLGEILSAIAQRFPILQYNVKQLMAH